MKKRKFSLKRPLTSSLPRVRIQFLVRPQKKKKKNFSTRRVLSIPSRLGITPELRVLTYMSREGVVPFAFFSHQLPTCQFIHRRGLSIIPRTLQVNVSPMTPTDTYITAQVVTCPVCESCKGLTWYCLIKIPQIETCCMWGL